MFQDQRLDEVFNPGKAVPQKPTPTKRRQPKQKASIQTPDPQSDIADSVLDLFDSDLSNDEEFLGFSAEKVLTEMPEFGIAQFEMEGQMTLFEEISGSGDDEEFVGFIEDEM